MVRKRALLGRLFFARQIVLTSKNLAAFTSVTLFIVVRVVGAVGWDCFKAITSELLLQVVGEDAEHTLVLSIANTGLSFAAYVARNCRTFKLENYTCVL